MDLSSIGWKYVNIIANEPLRPPAFLSEGFANYFNKVDWDKNVLSPMKQIQAKELLLPIEDIMENEGFYTKNSRITYPETAMFVKFLVEQKGKDQFKELYVMTKRYFTREETMRLMEDIYNQSYETLEEEWLAYLDTQLKQ